MYMSRAAVRYSFCSPAPRIQMLLTFMNMYSFVTCYIIYSFYTVMVFCIASKAVLIFIRYSEKLRNIFFIFNKYCHFKQQSLFSVCNCYRRKRGDIWDVFVMQRTIYIDASLQIIDLFVEISFKYKYYISGHYPSSCFYPKHRLIYILKHNVSEVGFCLRLQVKSTQ
jgi:hypothetical protein